MAAKNQNVAKKLTLPKDFGKMIAGATACYLALALHLYRPYIPKFEPVQYLFIINSIAGALGCFVLSRRWVSSFVGSLFAGAIYGFGPFALSFAAYHPFAGLPMAAVPWLFCQAAFFRHNTLHQTNGHEFVGLAVLKLLPIAAIALFTSGLYFLVIFFWSLFKGKKAPANPWNATTLEWQTPSPPKHGNWSEIPVVYHGPYEYSHPDMDRDWLAQNERPDILSPAHPELMDQVLPEAGASEEPLPDTHGDGAD